MRIMGLDYGAATVGVAISDELLLTAQGIETIRREKEVQLRKTYRRIEELAKEYGVERIVVGLPKLLNNDIGERARKAEEFAAEVHRRTGLPVELQDERLTTVEAHRVLDAAGTGLGKKKAVVDKLAAVLILQGYLDRRNYRKEE